MKNNFVKFGLIGLGAVVLIGVIVLVVLDVFGGNKRKTDDMIVTELAPSALLFGSSEGLYMDTSGNLTVKINGKEYLVMPDGSVWEYDESGNLKRVTEPAVINEVLTKALSSDGVLLDKDRLSENVSLADLTDSQIKDLAIALEVSESELKSMVNAARDGKTSGTSLAEAMKELDVARLSDEEIAALAEQLGMPAARVKEVIEKAKKEGRSLSVNELVEELADGYLKDWIESGLKTIGNDIVTVDQVYKAMAEQGLSGEEAMEIVSKEGFNGLLEKLGLKEKMSDPKEKKNSGGVVGEWEDENYGYKEPRQSDQNLLARQAAEEVSFLQGLGNTGSGGNTVSARSGGAGEYQAQNAQSDKRAFLQEFQNGTTVQKINYDSRRNMIIMGTPIKATLQTGLNTDLPGQIVAIVSENVYDSFTKTNILIPKFSRLIASYDSAVTWGQNRVLIAWTHLIRPDGIIVTLNGYQGIDKMGFSGQDGRVDNHTLSLIGATAMASLINVATGEINKSDVDNVLLSALLTGTTSGVQTVSQNLLNKHINRQPTIYVEPGTKIVILTNDNIELTTYDEDWERGSSGGIR